MQRRADSISPDSCTNRVSMLDEPMRGQIRYIAGSCIGKLLFNLQQQIKTKLHFSATRTLLLQVNFLEELKVCEGDIISSTNDAASLGEMAYKQGQSHGLTYISDAAFHFFVKLYQKVEEICTNDFLHSNLVTCQPQLELILQEDQSLLQVWFDLFKACDEGNEEYLIDLFCSVINNYSKISRSETLKRFKDKLPRKKNRH